MSCISNSVTRIWCVPFVLLHELVPREFSRAWHYHFQSSDKKSVVELHDVENRCRFCFSFPHQFLRLQFRSSTASRVHGELYNESTFHRHAMSCTLPFEGREIVCRAVWRRTVPYVENVVSEDKKRPTVRPVRSSLHHVLEISEGRP